MALFEDFPLLFISRAIEDTDVKLYEPEFENLNPSTFVCFDGSELWWLHE